MNTIDNSDEKVTVTGDLNAIPWIDLKEKREFSRKLGLAIGDNDLSFEDTVLLGNFPDWQGELPEFEGTQMSDEIVCKACGYAGKPGEVTKGSFAIEVVLC
jgi:hypothetical protein